MTDRETLDKAKALFTGATQGDTLARQVIAIAERKDKEIATLLAQRDELWEQLTPLKDAVLYARSQRRPMGIGQDSEIGAPTVTIGFCPRYGRGADNPGFWLETDTLEPSDADGPSATKRIALADPQHMGLVVVDYVQLIPPSRHGKSQLNRDQQVTEIFRQLKALAKEIRCPLLLVVSLSRKCEERQDKRPIPSDIRDSGNIESDADTICMLYRDEVYKPDTDDKGIAEFIVRKARNGATGTVRARWYADTTSFDDER